MTHVPPFQALTLKWLTLEWPWRTESRSYQWAKSRARAASSFWATFVKNGDFSPFARLLWPWPLSESLKLVWSKRSSHILPSCPVEAHSFYSLSKVHCWLKTTLSSRYHLWWPWPLEVVIHTSMVRTVLTLYTYIVHATFGGWAINSLFFTLTDYK